MISKLALILADYFATKSVYKHEEVNIYKYGFELLISTILNTIGILLVSLLMEVTIGAVLFCAAFVPLRLSAGGYHAKHHWSCILGFSMVFLVFALLNRFTLMEHIIPYSIASTIISALLVWSLAPVEAVNKPLGADRKSKQRHRSIYIVCVNLAVTEFFYAIKALNDYSTFLAFYNSGALAASLSLIVAEISKNGITQTEQ